MPQKPQEIPSAKTIDAAIDSIDSIVAWSITAGSRLGYFAALYKRITAAVRVALKQGAFENNARMERFDVAFANRYFAALNGYFYPDKHPTPTHAWQVTFDAASRREPIIVQHMLGGVNAHIGLDLGIIAQSIAPDAQLPSLQEDFNRINAVLGSQVNGVVESINELSPVLADLLHYAAGQRDQSDHRDTEVLPRQRLDVRHGSSARAGCPPPRHDPDAGSSDCPAGRADVQPTGSTRHHCQCDRRTREPQRREKHQSVGRDRIDSSARQDDHVSALRSAPALSFCGTCFDYLCQHCRGKSKTE